MLRKRSDGSVVVGIRPLSQTHIDSQTRLTRKNVYGLPKARSQAQRCISITQPRFHLTRGTKPIQQIHHVVSTKPGEGRQVACPRSFARWPRACPDIPLAPAFRPAALRPSGRVAVSSLGSPCFHRQCRCSLSLRKKPSRPHGQPGAGHLKRFSGFANSLCTALT